MNIELILKQIITFRKRKRKKECGSDGGESARRTPRHMGPTSIITPSTTPSLFPSSFPSPFLSTLPSLHQHQHQHQHSTTSQQPIALSLSLSLWFGVVAMKLVEEEYVGSNMSSGEADEAELELELGLELGLSLGAAKSKTASSGRFLTAKDFPCVSGTKRNADSVTHEPGSSPPRASQVVGWPPIRASRMHCLVNQAKAQRSEEDKVVISNKENSKEALKKKTSTNIPNVALVKEQANLGFVKVNVDGIAIGRKVDMNAHSSYESLAQTLADMFFRPGSSGETKDQGIKTSKLLDGSSEFVLTYEDKDGDWMLVGDVPWRMFLSSVKRLRIMRTSEATGLAPRFQERNERQRIKPI